MAIEEVLARYHQAADEFSRGNPGPVKNLLSGGEDVTLANPFGPAVRGWSAVSDALEFASSRFREGTVTAFEPMAMYATADLVTIFEIEQWTAKVGEREDATSFVLRVTSTFRREAGDWRLVHRHADPIATPDAEGPLRRQ